MLLLDCDTYQLCSFEGDDIPKYAILSHRWGDEETTFKDVLKGRQHDSKGWKKIQGCCEQAKRDGLSYIWADTCCIDKRSSAELSEAINSMYRWYQQSQICYAYLSDVLWFGHVGHTETNIAVARYTTQLKSKGKNECATWVCKVSPCSALFREEASALRHLKVWHNVEKVEICNMCGSCFTCTDHFRHHERAHDSLPAREARLKTSAWFSRGWTLQELLAPRDLVFFDSRWRMIGTKRELSMSIEARTKIPLGALLPSSPGHEMKDYCIAEKMSWAAERHTTRIEDRAYSLLGIFGINMPLLYGEGERAFYRLQEELIRTSDDASLLAWSRDQSDRSQPNSILARSPACFASLNDHGAFKSVPRGFSLTKSGLAGGFLLWRHCRHISATVLGYVPDAKDSKSPKVKVIVMYLIHVSNNEYTGVLRKNSSYGVYNLEVSQRAWDLSPRFPLSILPVPAKLYHDTAYEFPPLLQPSATEHFARVKLVARTIYTPKLMRKFIPESSPQPQNITAIDLQADIRASDHDHLFIDKDLRFSKVCLTLEVPGEQYEQGAIVLLFGYDLTHQPTVWFAKAEYWEGRWHSEIEHGVQIDMRTEQCTGSYLEQLPESISHVERIQVAGCLVEIQFVLVPQGHRVLVYCEATHILSQLPRRWVSSHPASIARGRASLNDFFS